MFERRLHCHIDWLLIAALLVLCAIGAGMIYSTTYDPTAGTVGPQLSTQFYALLFGVVAFAVCLTIDYRVLADHSLLIYGGMLALLVSVLLFGDVMGGARRWLSLGPANLQPSEFAKLALALLLATYFAENRRGTVERADLGMVALFTVIPFVLIAEEPDLGTAVGLLSVALGVTYLAGLRLRWLAVLATVAMLLAPVAWTYALEDYQRSRLSTFLDPARDARGAGYQQIQARITVGSGGLAGKGFLQGTQGQFNFLPVAHNDFIFSVLAEEQGFLGVIVALGLYLFVIVRGLDTARLAKDRLGAYLIVGVMASFAFQVVYNVTMSAGLAPVKGLTLPLMSYGGSSLIATLAGFGLVVNVRMRRFTN
ncbi:MAG TPA: rod shape-determining protein RodA [Acidobacteria bacterium]|jgi:rod shape determining protein RodA|nr:rod shape-determining protein RodA [Acidobacteriota bacterium]MDP6372907.1 rod shape-determining protein RodA [Vicinamibacterales bacterium]HAK56436.1 rod shape-determining protein RodA [Acidobacteriota bacterium]|tara:strand:+ start:2433 stop:3533 length:1101 start_codon:yes stop_codon:yes gene_type:complete